MISNLKKKKHKYFMKFIPSFAIEINVVNLLDFIKREFDETIYLICNDTVFLKLCMIAAIYCL